MTDDRSFESSWFNSSGSESMVERFNEIKSFAYHTFDELDRDKNGVIDKDELRAAFNAENTGEREKSFIGFLLTNHEAIREAVEEERDAEGISRDDIEAYFQLITQLMS